MDELAKYNIERWKALVEADAVFTRPALDLDPRLAQAQLDPENRLGNVAGKDVLCLACGGGQQSIAFALLEANVTVYDLSEAQLQRDREAATYFGVDINSSPARVPPLVEHLGKRLGHARLCDSAYIRLFELHPRPKC
jgi:2-polyprenyl-3-methyl-5-hydroxy-6-metoxy-1,4-benzoquinol methylase